jgi:hypothetical protein
MVEKFSSSWAWRPYAEIELDCLPDVAMSLIYHYGSSRYIYFLCTRKRFLVIVLNSERRYQQSAEDNACSPFLTGKDR